MKKLKLLAIFLMIMSSSTVYAGHKHFQRGFDLSDNRIYVASRGEVMLTFLSESASFSNDLFLSSEDTKILNSKSTPRGQSFSLGVFDKGDELVFKLLSKDTGHAFFNGPESRNPDGVIHAQYRYGRHDQLFVGFEDLWRGGDRDYNDLIFSLSNSRRCGGHDVLQPVPEPESYLLVAFGLLGLGLVISKRKNAS